jgi:hypothetical protein
MARNLRSSGKIDEEVDAEESEIDQEALLQEAITMKDNGESWVDIKASTGLERNTIVR